MTKRQPQPACAHDHLVEPYLIGELPEVEAAAFETHYFDCPTCAAGLTLGQAVADAARATARPPRTAEIPALAVAPVALLSPDPGGRERYERAPTPRATAKPSGKQRRWWVSLAAWGAVPLGAAAAIQALVVIPSLRSELALRDRPQALAPFTLRALTRGEMPRLSVGSADRFVTVQLDVAPPVADAYRASLLDAEERTVVSFGEVTLPRPPAGELFQVLIPVGPLVPGTYTLQLRPDAAGNQSAPEHYRFSLDKPGERP